MIFYKVKVTDKELRTNEEKINTTKFIFNTLQDTLNFVETVMVSSLNSIEIIKIESKEEDNNGKKKNV
jgi:hypothetical protein